MKKENLNEPPVAGYIAYYLKSGVPIKEGEITKLPLTISSKIIPSKLKKKFLETFNQDGKGNIPSEEELKYFLNLNT
jgi:hypothetical protein